MGMVVEMSHGHLRLIGRRSYILFEEEGNYDKSVLVQNQSFHQDERVIQSMVDHLLVE